MTCGSWWRVEWKGIRLKVPLDWRGASHLLEVGGAIDWLHQQIWSPTDLSTMINTAPCQGGVGQASRVPRENECHLM